MSKLGQSHSKFSFCHAIVAKCIIGQFLTIIDMTIRQKLVNLIGNIIFCNTQCQIGQFRNVIEFKRRQNLVNLILNFVLSHPIVAESKIGPFLIIIELPENKISTVGLSLL